MGRPADDALLGRTIAGKYLIESFIGGGAMGSVYRARQKEIDKGIAIKVLHRELLTDPQFAARFKREAKAASRLDHPNSMRVLDYGQEPDGLCYMAMELLDGRGLFQVLKEEAPLARERIVDLLRQTLAALAVAHELGVVHRDLKPENIIVLRTTDDEGRVTELVKVCDFGMAKISASRGEQAEHGNDEKLTSHGVVVGTPEYMSPEQGRGEELDGRSDIYSVGVILYQLLTGRLPFQAETAVGVLLKHLVEEAPAPSKVVPDVDPALEAICNKAMRKRREDRYTTAREMRSALASAIGMEAPPASRLSPHAVRLSQAEPRRRSPSLGEAATVQVLSPVATPGGVSARPVIRARELLSDPPAPPTHAVLPRLLGLLVLVLGAGLVFVWAARPQVAWLLPIEAWMDSLQSSRAAAQPATHSEPSATASVTRAPIASEQPVASAPVPPPPPASAASAAASASAPRPPAASASAPQPSPTIRTATAGAGGSPRPMAPATPTAPAPPPGPSPPVASAPPVPQAPGPFDAARVVIGAVKSDKASSADVISALPVARFNQCYRDGLRARGSPASGPASLHLDLDASGRVNFASFAGAESLASTAGDCIANAAISRVVHLAEPGPTAADVELSFKAE